MSLGNSRISLGALVLALGCNALLGNEEGYLAGAGGTPSGVTGGQSARSGGTTGTSGNTAEAGAPAVEGGAPGSEPGGAPGAAGAAEPTGGRTAAGGSGAGASSGNTNEGGAAGALDSGTGGQACECTPGTIEPMQVPCEPCGMATVSKACLQDCRWSDYGAPGACVAPSGACMPGEEQMLEDVVPCDKGGWRYQKRVCDDQCAWGAPVDATACEYGQNECDGCACVSICTPSGGGLPVCLWIDCSEASARSECAADVPDICGASRTEWTFRDWRPR